MVFMKEPKKKSKPTIKYYKIVEGHYLEYHISIKGLYRYMYFIVSDDNPAYMREIGAVWNTTSLRYDVSWSECRHLNTDIRKVTKLEVLVMCGSVPSEKKIRKAIGPHRE